MKENPPDWKILFVKNVKNITVRGDNAFGQCPFHEDRAPSFAVNIHTSQWICHAGCGKGNYWTFKAWLEDPSKIKPIPTSQPQQKEFKTEKIVSIYTYKDQSGKPLFEVKRLEPKSFRQNKIGGSNMDGVTRVPYHLDEIVKRPDEILFWVEGEKDVDNLSSLGFLSSTSPGGANNWEDSLADFIPNKYILICPDQDSPGFLYAKNVSDSFFRRGNTIFFYHSPQKDVSDLIEDGVDIKKEFRERNIYKGSRTKPIDYFNSVGINIPEWNFLIKDKKEFLRFVTASVFDHMEFWSDRFRNPVDLIDIKGNQVTNKSTYEDFLSALKELHETRCFLAKLH